MAKIIIPTPLRQYAGDLLNSVTGEYAVSIVPSVAGGRRGN